MKKRSDAEKKKIIVLFGSPHKDGFTDSLLSVFFSAWEGDFFVNRYNLFEMNVAYCTDCGICKRERNCAFDDLNPLMKNLEEADILVIASPVHNLSVSAPLKTLFDRFQRYYNARFIQNIRPPIKRPKQGLLLLTCGSSETDGFEIVERQVKQIFSILNTKLLGKITVSQTDTEPFSEETKDRIKKEARDLTSVTLDANASYSEKNQF